MICVALNLISVLLHQRFNNSVLVRVLNQMLEQALTPQMRFLILHLVASRYFDLVGELTCDLILNGSNISDDILARNHCNSLI